MDSWPNDCGFDTDFEQPTPVQLVVKGDIPDYAAGVLYRTGPVGYKVNTNAGETWSAKHWFDGFSAVHRFQIDCPENGPAQVTYRSRRIVDEYLELVRTTGKLNSITFAAKRDPCKSVFNKVLSMFYAKRNAKNVGVTLSINMPGGGYKKNSEKPAVNGHSSGIETLHTKTDATFFKKIDPETLEPEGIAFQAKLHPDLKGPFSAAHAKSDPVTGDMFNFNLEIAYNSTYRVFCTNAVTGETEILATFHARPAYIHSLFLTENYVVLCVWNSFVKWAGISVLYEQNVADAIAPFDPSQKASWYVVDRRHGKGLVATYDSNPFFSFHSINAWEEPSASDPSKTDIITELSLYDNIDVIHRFYYDNIKSMGPGAKDYAGKKRESCLPSQAQFRLPSVDSTVSSSTHLPAELIFKADKSISMELPTINPSYLTRRHRFVYGTADRLKSSFMDGIVKFDNKTQRSIFWEIESHTPGEPIFVADPKGEAEDDGVLLSVVLDGQNEKSYLLVLDAKDLKELGRAEVGGPVAFGFHGAHKASGRVYAGDI
ncbi:carotenoid oxygenase [Pleomassaria siparia CBS 279.74]|uniref:Carotenoid oxygenase n=1 Tax=Pleomassaria siparia CBS 279.74 TaxID=1314801 RepID=A0A6G1KSE9_9PLEO|nr:carotenoid oxygenase [Pleomassaria siparia CBS 279.74]